MADRFFTPATFSFLRALDKNNNRDWFTSHKSEFEEEVQDPAVRFIADVGPALTKLSPHVTFDARPFGGSLGRIYRDTRFSKDKSPYKTTLGIHFAHERASKEENLPGFFLHVGPGESMVASGIWRPAPPALSKIRDAIVRDASGWAKIVGKGIEIGGESYARVPAGYDADHRYASDLKRKDFFASRSFSDAKVGAPGFRGEFLAACKSLDPLNGFLARAVGVPW